MKKRRFGWKIFVIIWLLGWVFAVMKPLRCNPNSHWDLHQPTEVFPYVTTPYWLSRPGFFNKAYYTQRLEQGYGLFYNSTTAKECLVAMDDIFFYQIGLMQGFHYQPADIKNSCPSCAGKSLPALAESAQYTTPSSLPDGVIAYLKLLGVYEMVCRQIDHIFFVPDRDTYPDLFAYSYILATGDPVTRSVLISKPLATLYESVMATVIAHEAFHLEHNNDYHSYPASEKAAHAFELKLLREILRLSTGTLTEAEKTKIGTRIELLENW